MLILPHFAMAIALSLAPPAVGPERSANAFGLELHRALADSGNLLLSAYSVHTALAMTYAGARGRTEKEMARTLRFGSGQAAAHAGAARLAKRLDSIESAGQVRLEVANAIWAERSLAVRNSFLAIQEKHYATGFQRADFAGNPEGERLRINQWAEDRTQGRIQDLIRPGLIKPLTAMVLCNAIYFKGRWATVFDSNFTEPGDFHLAGGKTKKVLLMSVTARFRHARVTGGAALELPYVGGDLSMVVLLPDSGGRLETLEAAMGTGGAKDPLEALKRRDSENAIVTLPRFKLTRDYDLIPPLQRMGMKEAFGMGADFSGLAKEKGLYIDAVVHKAFVEVNEEGTEAGAATAVMILKRGGGPRPAVFRADRPFVFLIRENRTGLILFSGRLVDPG